MSHKNEVYLPIKTKVTIPKQDNNFDDKYNIKTANILNDLAIDNESSLEFLLFQKNSPQLKNPISRVSVNETGKLDLSIIVKERQLRRKSFFEHICEMENSKLAKSTACTVMNKLNKIIDSINNKNESKEVHRSFNLRRNSSTIDVSNSVLTADMSSSSKADTNLSNYQNKKPTFVNLNIRKVKLVQRKSKTAEFIPLTDLCPATQHLGPRLDTLRRNSNILNSAFYNREQNQHFKK